MDTRAKISTLWVVVMMNMIYADILGFLGEGVLEEMISGYAGEIKLTETLILIAALMVEIPIIMILLSRILKYKINRIVNIAAACFTILFIIGGGSLAWEYIFIASVETILMLCIIWIAWNWKEPAE